MFEYNAPSTFTNLFEMANTNDDGGDEFFGKFHSVRLIIIYVTTMAFESSRFLIIFDLKFNSPIGVILLTQ